MTATEYVVLVDEYDNEIGTAEKLIAHQQNLKHRAFSVFVFRNNPDSGQKELLLQQRALQKYHSPGLWTNTCCSHPRPSESVIAAGERRLFEEMGIQVPLKKAGSFQYIAHFSNGLVENEFDHVLVGLINAQSVQANKDEVHAWKWINVVELEDQLQTSSTEFTAWFEQGLKIARSFLALTQDPI